VLSAAVVRPQRSPLSAPPPTAPAAPSLPRLARGFVVGAIIAVAAYAALALLSDWEAVSAAARGIPPAAIGLALLASTGNFVLRWVRWELYLRRIAVRVPLRDSVLVFLAGFSMSLTPGKVGELLKPGLLHARHGAPLAALGSVVVAERITDLLAVATLLGLGALAAPEYGAIAGLVWLGVLAGTAVLVSPPLARVLAAIARKLPAGDRIAGLVERLVESLRALSRPDVLVPALALSVGAWGLQCASLWLVVSPMPALDLGGLESVLAYTAPLLAGAAALVPGGVGVAEATMAGLVAHLGEGPLTEASAATAIVRGVTLWWAVAVGLVAGAGWALTSKQPPPPTPGPPSP
jgi:uncharacterized protein (TIRG00374 family)